MSVKKCSKLASQFLYLSMILELPTDHNSLIETSLDACSVTVANELQSIWHIVLTDLDNFQKYSFLLLFIQNFQVFQYNNQTVFPHLALVVPYIRSSAFPHLWSIAKHSTIWPNLVLEQEDHPNLKTQGMVLPRLHLGTYTLKLCHFQEKPYHQQSYNNTHASFFRNC